MFESVTKRRKNPIINFFGWTLLSVVCVVFVFIGFSPDSSFLGQGGAAAEVNGEAISIKEFSEMRERLESQGKGGSSREERRKVQENAMNILVSRSLIIQEAEKLNIHVSDSEVGQELLAIEPFYEDGVFSKTRYKTYLRQARLTAAEFEDKIRRDLVIQKMSNLIGFAAKDVGIIDEFDEKIDQAQVNVGYVKLSPDILKAGPESVSPSEYLQKNEQKVKDYYQAHKSEYATPEQVKARHILIKAKDETKESMEKALAQVLEVAETASVDNFSALAKKHSDDPGSKEKGGDLGFFPRGRMVPEFEKVAFTAKVGEITKPVKTQYGYHLILVDEKKEASESDFDSVKTQIAKKMLQENAYEATLGEVSSYLKQDDHSKLEDFLNSKGLQWKNTGFFSITKDSIPGVGQNKEFLDLAVQLGPENEYADHLVYQGETAYLLKFKGAKMDQADKQNSQMDFFRQLMKQQKMNSMVQTWTDSLRNEASIKMNADLLR